jgi:peptidoglycan lytic transglycosylase
MLRHNAASLCVLSLIAADVLVIGAAGLRPKIPFKTEPVMVLLAPPALSPPPAPTVADVPDRKPPPPEPKQIGIASWYGDAWQGRITASGQRFDDQQLTAAHRTLPLNSRVKVTNLRTGRSVEVTITDRGPYARGRVIDLSEAAAKKLGMVKKGVAPVKIENAS